MKKNVLLLLAIVLIQSLSAQTNVIKTKKAWFDFQIAQHIGLNQWSNSSYVNDGFPAAALTEFRVVYNHYAYLSYFGFFADMSLGLMPAPDMKSLALDRMPMPQNGTQYYLREILSESGNNSTSAQFKMTFGLFGNIPINEKLAIMPYLGVGSMTMPMRKYDIILKEQGSNMQYETLYIWNALNNNDYSEPASLNYLTGKLNFQYKVSEKLCLLLGLEYLWSLNTLDFYGKYTNTFNANIERDFTVKGNKMNMLGISVGISFK